MTQDRADARWIRFGTPAALFVLALVVRASPWRDVFAGGQVMPPGNDAWYHLRRIVYAVFHGGFLEFDRYLNFPAGARPIWPPWFDLASAAVLAPFVPAFDAGGQARLEALAVWIPPVLGAIGVVVTYGAVRRHWGFAAGALAGGMLCLLSAHFWYSQVGFVDHHAAVAAAAAMLLAAGLGLIAAHQQAGRLRLALAAAWAGAISGVCLLIWPGSLLHVGLVQLGLLGYLLTRRADADARSFAGALTLAFACAFLVVFRSGMNADWPQWGRLSPVVLSRFQPLSFGVAALVLAGCVAVWRERSPLGRGVARRAASFLGLSAAIALSLWLAFPELAAGVEDAWRWLAKEESFQSQVSESLPLFQDGGSFSTRIAIVRLSLLVFALPFAGPWLLWRHRGRPHFPQTALLVVFALGLFGVTLLQKRFFNTASIGLAGVAALAVVELWRSAGERRHARATRATLALAVAGCLLPSLEPYARSLDNELRALRGAKQRVTGVFVGQSIGMETALWLREHTPPTAGWLDASVVPEYGVLAPWPMGHLIQYVARRPTLVDNFGDDLGEASFAFVERFYLSPEAPERVDAARARGVRYVVAQAGSAYLSRPPTRGSLAHALFWLDGSRADEVPALSHHRLVFESRGLSADAPPLYKLYELVAGARIQGRAAPGARIELRVGVVTNRGRRFFYASAGVADEEGRYRFRVPYPTGEHGEVQVAPLYRLKCGDEVGGLAVSETAIREGALLIGPALCRGGGG